MLKRLTHILQQLAYRKLCQVVLHRLSTGIGVGYFLTIKRWQSILCQRPQLDLARNQINIVNSTDTELVHSEGDHLNLNCDDKDQPTPLISICLVKVSDIFLSSNFNDFSGIIDIKTVILKHSKKIQNIYSEAR